MNPPIFYQLFEEAGVRGWPLDPLKSKTSQ